MSQQKIDMRFGTLCLLLLMAALSRLIPHPPNFSPIGAMSLFGAAYFSRKHFAILLPIAAMWIRDLIINNVVYAEYFDGFVFFYQGFYWTYSAFIVIAIAGFLMLKRIKVQNIIAASLLASLLFFLISNFGVWASGTMYPKSLEGLMACYAAGLPFLKNTLAGDLVYSGVLFGAFEYAKYKIPALKMSRV